MRTAIDSAGRLVVPKALMEEVGLAPGQELELRVVDGRLEVEVPATPMRLEERDGDLVVVTDAEVSQLTLELVRGPREIRR